MARFAIKHKPTGKFLYEDEGGSFLVNETESFFTFGNKEQADELFKFFIDNNKNNMVNIILTFYFPSQEKVVKSL